MLVMFLYGISLMYTPGPINIMALNLGFNKKFKSSINFFIGVGVAMFFLFLIFGYTGEKIINKKHLIYISSVGVVYIFYLAYKIFKSNVEIEEKNIKVLTFKDGFIMQFFNPKAMLVTLPITTINFPFNNIKGIKILIMSLIFSFIVIGAPSIYCLLGQFFSKKIKERKILYLSNKIMAFILIYVASDIMLNHIYLVLMGIKKY